MASVSFNDPDSEEAPKDRPLELNMTDVEAERAPHPERGVDAAGTPGGGTAAGGLAGTNIDDGSPDEAEEKLEDALGSGLYDNEDDQPNAEEERGWRRRKRLLE